MRRDFFYLPLGPEHESQLVGDWRGRDLLQEAPERRPRAETMSLRAAIGLICLVLALVFAVG